jgi:predicted  nucleic acid-binding Zn-ribbon protein
MVNLLKPQQKVPQQPQIDITRKIGDLSERARLIEERLKQTREKMQVLDETFSSKVRDLKDAISDLNVQISTMRKELDEVKEIVRKVVKELGNTAKLSDVKVLEKYINLIDITRFITKEDVEEIVEEKLKKLKK